MIGVITAMESEASKLKNDIKNPVIKEISGVKFTIGDFCNKKICIAVSGIGKVLAAITTEAMILNFDIDYVISTGVAGGLSDRLDIGDIAIADKLVQHDLDTTGIGDPKGLVSGINKIYFETDKVLTDSLLNVSRINHQNYELGVIASGDTFITDNRGINIKNEFNAIACEMESASIATVCYINKVRFICFRAISDKSNKDSTEDYSNYLKKACDSSYNLIKEFLKIA